MVYWILLFNFCIFIITFEVVYLVIKRLLAGNKITTLEKVDWKKDVVYLFQFPRQIWVPNISPFALKVETYLKSNRIPYEVIETFIGRSKQGLIPFIELNGKQYADSQFILLELRRHFLIKTEKKTLLPKKSDVFGEVKERLFDRMVDTSLFAYLYIQKVLWQPVKTAESMLEHRDPGFLKHILGMLLKHKAYSRFHDDGTALHNPEDLDTMMTLDLNAVETFLKLNHYDIKSGLSIAECSIFGHLAPNYFAPYELKIQTLLNERYPNTKDFITTVMNDLY